MSDDHMIDDALRSVPLPDSLESRLQPEALFNDASLDRLLIGVTVPAGLGKRIHSAVHGHQSQRRDGAIDLSRFAALAGRGGLTDALPVVRPDRPPRRMSLAGLGRDIVSVATALGLVGVLTLAGIEFSRQLEGDPAAPRSITQLNFTDPIDETAGDRPLRMSVHGHAWGGANSALAVPTVVMPEAVRDGVPSGSAGSGMKWPSAGNPMAEGGVADPRDADPIVPERLPTVRGAAVASGLQGGMGGMRGMGGIFGATTLATVEVPTAVRRSVPRVLGYDLPFEMATGEQPFVDPGANPVLAVDHPPLTLRLDGFEAATAVDRGNLARIRAEDVLAAVPAIPFVPSVASSVRLGIHEVLGLRSMGGARSVLVEVAASAGPVRGGDRSLEPLDVTLVLDQAAAGDPTVWRRICRGVGDLAAQLGPEDRVGVVLAGSRPRVAVQAADPAGLAALASDLEWQGASGGSDLDSGLLLARPAPRVIVIAHAVSLENGGETTREALSTWHNALASVGGDAIACEPEGGTRFIVLDPATPSPREWREPTFGRTSHDAVSIRRALIQQVTGCDTLVASQCELEVRFDPRRVARYRLVGHHQSAIESLAEAPPRGADLHAGETVRVVYEVIPRGTEKLGGLASAVLAWRTATGDGGQVEARPSRSASDLRGELPSVHGCELLLAAGVGELAAGSAHITRRPAFIAALDQLVAEWRARGDITPFGEALARSLHDRRGR